MNDLTLIGIAWRLDRLRWTPNEVLMNVVHRHGSCEEPTMDQPPCGDEVLADHELAARLCATCPVQDECLELELRTAGENTVGVWGALSDQDRHDLHPHWLRRGERWERP